MNRLAIIGGSLGVAIVILTLAFLPVVPVAFASSTTLQPSAKCEYPPTGTWIFDWNGGSTSQGFHIPRVDVGSIVFSYSYLQNKSWIQRPPQYWNSTSLKWVNNGTAIVHKRGITNTTYSVNLQNLNIVHSNGSLNSANVQAIINGSLDSYVKLNGLSVTTTKFNATAVRVTLAISHVEIQNGPQLSKTASSPPFDSQFSISLDNFKMGILYNCVTGKVSYGLFGMALLPSVASVAKAIFGAKS